MPAPVRTRGPGRRPGLLIFPSIFVVAAVVLGFVLLGQRLQRRGTRRD